jgi:hypothetical protein
VGTLVFTLIAERECLLLHQAVLVIIDLNMSEGKITKMEVDYSATVDQILPECQEMAKVFNNGIFLFYINL